ncbi:FAD-dependent monooxygenase [Streptomyces sp. Edi2]
MDTDIEVLIVGAGPTGLLLANELDWPECGRRSRSGCPTAAASPKR